MEEINIQRAREGFGRLLQSLRHNRRLTLSDLEYRSGVKYSAIGAIEKGSRAAGPDIASKLADGLLLMGKDKSEFLAAADDTLVYSKESDGFNEISLSV